MCEWEQKDSNLHRRHCEACLYQLCYAPLGTVSSKVPPYFMRRRTGHFSDFSLVRLSDCRQEEDSFLLYAYPANR